MAINFETADPQKLLTTYKRLIDQRHVISWSYDKDGDFTHTPDQWANKAWLRPSVFNGRLILNFVGNQNVVTTSDLYGVYHGRFLESMLSHCDTLFSSGAASAMPTNSDHLTQAA